MKAVRLLFSINRTLTLKCIQDSEYIKTAEEAWNEAVELADSTDGWKEEKKDKANVRT